MAHLNHGKCIHFNGVQNKTCDAGMDYKALFGKESGMMLRAACWKLEFDHTTKTFMPIDRRDQKMIPCGKYREPTAEEISAYEADMQARMNQFRVVMTAIAPWRKQPPRGKQTVIDCPTGCGGKLHLSQSSYNGHVHAQCSTANCVNWME